MNLSHAEDIPGTLIAGGALIGCCVYVALLLRSRQPDPKMSFLISLIEASGDHPDEPTLSTYEDLPTTTPRQR